MSDLVAMLRVSESDPVQQEAADEIERLREENARLRAEVERLQNYYTELMTTNAAIREGKVSDEERKPTSLKWRKSIYPDLAKVEDWLNKKGYTGEAGAVHVAMDEILELGIESARLIRENKVAFEAVGGVVKANDKLKEENARLREAVGLMTTMAPFMEVDVNDPVGMAKTVCAEQEKLFQENARLREALQPFVPETQLIDPAIPDTRPIDVMVRAGELRAAAAAIREGGEND